MKLDDINLQYIDKTYALITLMYITYVLQIFHTFRDIYCTCPIRFYVFVVYVLHEQCMVSCSRQFYSVIRDVLLRVLFSNLQTNVDTYMIHKIDGH